MIVGNHSYSHPAFSKLSYEQAVEEIEKNEALHDRQIPFRWWKDLGLDKDIDTFWTFDFAEYLIRNDSNFTKDDVFKRINDPAPEFGTALLKDGFE
ncbi:MAG: hypothetical protein J5372_02600 [Lachnospiraceae bacterium]|nr:hypothetical protein [Lachnospiraceae bacterium]